MRTRTTAAAAALGVALAVLLAACSPAAGGADAPTASAQGSTESSAPDMPAVDEVTLGPLSFPREAGAHDLEVEVFEPSGRSELRRLRVHVPSGTGPFPLVVALHPFGSSGQAFEEQTALGSQGAARGAIVLLPDGVNGAWNAALTCCRAGPGDGRDDRPDVGYVLALIDAASSALPVEAGRARVTGFSNGGYLAYRLACRAADRIGAIAVVAGTMDEPCTPSEPVSVLHVHGEDDLVVPFVDDRSPHSPQAASRGAADVVAAWAELDGCANPEVSDDRKVWSDCGDGTHVEFVPVPGLAHAWPQDRPVATTVVLDFLLQPTD